MVNIAGWLSWQALRSLVPWASPWLGYALAAIATVGIVWLHGYMIGSQGKGAAVAARDSQWVTEISETNNDINEARRRARNAADRVGPTPIDSAQRMQLCRQSPTCRERDQ